VSENAESAVTEISAFDKGMWEITCRLRLPITHNTFSVNDDNDGDDDDNNGRMGERV
jgi:hypothetical protein